MFAFKVVDNKSTGTWHIISPNNEQRFLCGRKYDSKNFNGPIQFSRDDIKELEPLCAWCWSFWYRDYDGQ